MKAPSRTPSLAKMSVTPLATFWRSTSMADRLANEYALECIFEAAPYAEARWVNGDRADVEDFTNKHRSAMAHDIDEQPVFLGKSSWEIGYVAERYPKVRFERTKERG